MGSITCNCTYKSRRWKSKVSIILVTNSVMVVHIYSSSELSLSNGVSPILALISDPYHSWYLIPQWGLLFPRYGAFNSLLTDSTMASIWGNGKLSCWNHLERVVKAPRISSKAKVMAAHLHCYSCEYIPLAAWDPMDSNAKNASKLTYDLATDWMLLCTDNQRVGSLYTVCQNCNSTLLELLCAR